MSNRILKINHLIKQEIGQIIFKEVDFPKDVLVTVTRVETTLDLEEAKVYVSVIPEEKTNLIFHILENQIYNLQQKLNKRLKMKPIPKIKFSIEKETGKAAKIEEILEQLKKEK